MAGYGGESIEKAHTQDMGHLQAEKKQLEREGMEAETRCLKELRRLDEEMESLHSPSSFATEACSVTSTIKSRSNQPNAVVGSPDLQHAVELLADGIQSCMAALFDLQTGLIDVVAQSPKFSTPSKRFERSSGQNGEETLLFSSRAKGTPTITCLFASSHSMNLSKTAWSFARNILQISPAKFSELNPLMTICTPGCRGSDIRLYPHFRASNIARTGGALRLNGHDALAQSYDALRGIRTALGDMDAFWRDHVLQLISITSESA